MVRRPENVYARYHAHVYFGPETAAIARLIWERAPNELPEGTPVGRFHEKTVGPHPHWSFQIAFDAARFDAVVGWLASHRKGLDVLVHGDTGNDYEDHTQHVMWLGEPAVLDLSVFRS